MTYILIIFAFYGNVSITTVEFDNKSACEYAQKQVAELNSRTQTTCVPKEARE